MKRIALVVVALLATTVSTAEIYQWKDKNGKTIYSDQAPIGTVVEKTSSSTSSAPSAAPAAKTTADRDMESRKKQKEAQDAAEKAKLENEAAAGKQENCVNARRYLATLDSGERIAMRDDKGERYYMSDEQRAQEKAKAQQAVDASCK